jgi:hypothetical protein
MFAGKILKYWWRSSYNWSKKRDTNSSKRRKSLQPKALLKKLQWRSFLGSLVQCFSPLSHFWHVLSMFWIHISTKAAAWGQCSSFLNFFLRSFSALTTFKPFTTQKIRYIIILTTEKICFRHFQHDRFSDNSASLCDLFLSNLIPVIIRTLTLAKWENFWSNS